MLSTIITSIISFISTNIDDIFILMIFYTQVDNRMRNRDIVIGQYLGIAILTTLSIIGAMGLNFLPEKYIGALGLLPILLGIKAWLEYRKEKIVSIDSQSDAMNETNPKSDSKLKLFLEKMMKPEIVSVTLISIANGADNIGIYIPIFSSYTLRDFIITIMIFIIMLGIWCFAGYKFANYPFIKTKLQTYKHVLVPVIYIGLGIFIVLRSGILDGLWF